MREPGRPRSSHEADTLRARHLGFDVLANSFQLQDQRAFRYDLALTMDNADVVEDQLTSGRRFRHCPAYGEALKTVETSTR